MNILLVSPEYPDTFWSFKHALRFVSKKVGQPPLGLLTVASLLPAAWEKRLVDLNLRKLSAKDLQWADYVFIGGMGVQAESARAVIAQCNEIGKPVVAGGPLFTARHEEFDGVAHFVLNEAEITLPLFLDDLRTGHAKPLYTTAQWADVRTTPLPMWNLIDQRQYATMNMQYSRGCPYDCEFCDITVLYGRLPRTKSGVQVVAEMDALYRSGWRGHVFFVDDNFIGNRVKLKNEVLPAIITWMEEKGHPFTLGTEASLNLSDDAELLAMMARAGFEEVFVGIESPNAESLEECKKITNKNRDLIASVKTLQKAGLQVQGGFIVGFDHDPPTIFDSLIHFIRESGIVVAMVGLLNAPINSRLYHRLGKEERLLEAFTGNNTDFSMNFIPKMHPQALRDGYRKILATIYSPKEYYERVMQFLRTHEPLRQHVAPLQFAHLRALSKSMLMLGVIGKERLYYWKLFFWTLFRRPRLFTTAITLAIYGFHFRRVFEQYY
ncbi:MAG TPA: B12-binding domain-containing radical SAM protein [Bacteroidota bacterium]|nr:B12-binding domain-containing radical SAM protein [Bacteroidota bacterium]